MFLLDYWIFEGDRQGKTSDGGYPTLSGRGEQTDGSQNAHPRSSPDYVEGWANASTMVPIFPPLRPHSEEIKLHDSFLRYLRRDALVQRGFQCPANFHDCSAIGQPNSCCSSSDTCITITDTGTGSVGCCPNGQTCAGSISCDTANGYTSCPQSSNGGCCLPGYSCLGVGCIITGTSTATAFPTPSSTLLASPSSSAVASSSPQPTTTAIVVVPTSPGSSTTYTCSPGWFTCPASLGGGCCQSGLQCALGVFCPTSSTTLLPSSGSGASTSSASSASSASGVSPSAPVRPTSGNSNPVTTTPTPSSSIPSVSLCPTGFYVCSAYYPSGCCRVGRDCHTTGSCVEVASTVVVGSGGVTVAAPSGAGFATTAAAQRGSCPSGWYSCAASLGGNCCLNGYSCGAECTATGTAGQTQVAGKVAPSAATRTGAAVWVWSTLLIGVVVGVGMGAF